MRSILFHSAVLCASALLIPLSAQAGSRRFTYVYESTTQPTGAVELENSVTWSTNRIDGKRVHEFDFRHELEWGVTDRLQLSLYVADWNYVSGGEDRGARYQDTAIEAIYSLTNPNTDWLGSAIYGELTVGDTSMELEGKLLLQKNLGPLILAYNVALEASWEGEKFGSWDERTGEFSQVLGASYELTPHFSVGAELLTEIEWPEWAEPQSPHVFAGPNASVRFGRIWATVTPLIRLAHQESEPELQTRLIVGYEF